MKVVKGERTNEEQAISDCSPLRPSGKRNVLFDLNSSGLLTAIRTRRLIRFLA